MTDSDKTPLILTSCCQADKILCTVYEWVEGRGRLALATVPACARCLLQVGTLKIRPDAPKDFTPDLWRRMLLTTRGDRFYCIRENGVLVPQGKIMQHHKYVKPAPQINFMDLSTAKEHE